MHKSFFSHIYKPRPTKYSQQHRIQHAKNKLRGQRKHLKNEYKNDNKSNRQRISEEGKRDPKLSGEY